MSTVADKVSAGRPRRVPQRAPEGWKPRTRIRAKVEENPSSWGRCTHWWREASDLPEELHRYRAAGYQDGFVACRYGFEAIECWRENEGVPV